MLAQRAHQVDLARSLHALGARSRWTLSIPNDAAVANAKKGLLTKLGNTIHVEVESFSRMASNNGAESDEFREIARLLERVDFA